MAKKTAGDVLVETPIDWGVSVFSAFRETAAYTPGQHPVHSGTPRGGRRFRGLRLRQMDGKARCLRVTSGPGGIHLLNGLYDAKPVFAITGLQFHDLLGTFTQQDVALDKLFTDVCVFNERVMGVAHVQNMTELACRSPLAFHEVAHATIPVDVQSQSLGSDQRSERNIPQRVSEELALCSRQPSEEQLARAAAILNAGKKTVILAGRGAIGAGAELAAVAERLGAPVAKALLGKAALPDDNPYCTGGVGLLGTKPSQEALEDCDTLLIAGSSFPYIEFYPKPGKVPSAWPAPRGQDRVDRPPQTWFGNLCDAGRSDRRRVSRKEPKVQTTSDMVRELV